MPVVFAIAAGVISLWVAISEWSYHQSHYAKGVSGELVAIALAIAFLSFAFVVREYRQSQRQTEEFGRWRSHLSLMHQKDDE